MMLFAYPSPYEANQCHLLRVERGLKELLSGRGNPPPQSAASLEASAI